MRKLIGLLAILIVLGAGAAHAYQFKIQDGRVKTSVAHWLDSGVAVTPEAQKHPAEAELAFREPGKIVVAQQEVVNEVADVFHYRQDTIRRLGVKYYTQEKLIDVVTGSEIMGTTRRIFPVPILLLVSIGTFLIFIRTKDVAVDTVAAALTVSVSVVAAGIVAAGLLTSGVVAAFAALGAALVVAIAIPDILGDKNSGRKRKVLSIMFFGLIALSAGLVYYPLFF
ncbi:MAG: hypothetical protein ACYC4I_01760 [Minisyncoccota bacterium]